MALFCHAGWLIAVQSDPSDIEVTTMPVFSFFSVLILLFALVVAVVGIGLAIFLVMRAIRQK